LISPQTTSAAITDPGRAAQVLERFRQPIEESLQRALSDRGVPLYEMLRYHLGLDGGSPVQGKALRPTLCLLVCQALGGDWTKALPAAASIELVHNFSLIHDDIQDEDRERRHRPTIWSKWGVPQAINAGDAMFCLANLTLHDLRPLCGDALVVEVLDVLQEATREMIEGQYLDVSYENTPEISLDAYFDMIGRKTGALLRASVEIGALLAGTDATVRQRCRQFGEAIGRLFQIRDDMLGVWGESDTTGKPADSDIRRRKKSLPIVAALSYGSPEVREELLTIYAGQEVADAQIVRVLQLFADLSVRERVQVMADEAYQRAMALAGEIAFTPGGRSDLEALASFLLERDR